VLKWIRERSHAICGLESLRFKSLADWLSWQESLNPKEIDLGLERVSRVLHRSGHANHFNCPLISVAGTNGKGSVVAYLEAMALASGSKVCSYTSPHLLRYNERIRINGNETGDEQLCMAFERIDQARGDEELTYFEFGTLAAIDLFFAAKPDLVIMEIGLGGRLDAVNVMEPDVAVITTVAIDHTDWLGDNRESIGFEKAGVLRAGRPAVCGDLNPPQSLVVQAANIQAQLKLIGKDYNVEKDAKKWRYIDASNIINELPLPALAGEFQLNNAATAIMALRSLRGFEVNDEAIRQGLSDARLPGRFQVIGQQPEFIVDVAHNPQAAVALASQLRERNCAGKTYAVVAMLADKPAADVVALLAGEVDGWYTAGLESVSRGLGANDMATVVEQQASDVKLCAAQTIAEACKKALSSVTKNDRIIVFGSFYVVAEAMQFFASQR
jgi:dihydrofolate synthase/folylpolyglutamate synthase